MQEYKVEYIEVSKKYASVTVEADSRSEAIQKAKQSNLDNESLEFHETSFQSEWTAANNRTDFFSWLSLLWQPNRR